MKLNILFAIFNVLIFINLIAMQFWLKTYLDKIYVIIRGIQLTVKLTVKKVKE